MSEYANLPQQRHQHRQDVIAFLRQHFISDDWELTLPHGWGNETYFAAGNGRSYFVKLNAPIANYEAMAALGLTPPIVAVGQLDDGTSILVQPRIAGRTPSRKDFQEHWERFAVIVRQTHRNEAVQQVLPKPASEQYRDAGLAALARIQQRWQQVKTFVPAVADFVDESLAQLKRQISAFQGGGLVASHNDICNANWLITPSGEIYLIDLDAMSWDDPANDLGALLWWYYPPTRRPRFLKIVGYTNDESLRNRMRVRMALHCLHIILPRQQSFDRFNPDSFAGALTDFRAVLAGKENPQGYSD